MESAKPTFGSRHPPFPAPHNPVKKHTQVCFKHTNLSPMNPVNKVSFKCPCSKLEERGNKQRGKIQGNIISIEGFQSVAFSDRKKQTVKCRSVEKMCPPHPCGELQLTLHLPTRRQGGIQLTSSDWRVNPNLAIRHSPGPLIMSRRQDNSRAGEEADRGWRQADRRGEEREQSSRETLSL